MNIPLPGGGWAASRQRGGGRQGAALCPDPVQCSLERPGTVYPRHTDTFAANAGTVICERNKINIWLRSRL